MPIRRLLPPSLLFWAMLAFGDAPSFRLEPGKAEEWTPNAPGANSVSVSVGPGARDKDSSVRLDYSFAPGEWVEASRTFDLKQDHYGRTTFWWRGTASGVIFELKFIDEDNTVFGLKFPTRGLSPKEWKKVTIPWKDLHVMWGGNQKVDRIHKIAFALSGRGGKGFLEISEFKSEPAPGYSVEVEANQIGYHPAGRKEFVVRVEDLPAGAKTPAELPFRVVSERGGEVRAKGVATRQAFNDWPGIYYLGEFTKLEKDGKYRIDVDFKLGEKPQTYASHPFEIGPRVLSHATARLEFEFLKKMQCGEKCHQITPLKGGYHDTRFDISQRMWAIPSVVIGVQEYAERAPYQWDVNDNDVSDALEELAYGVEFCAKFPEPDGTVSWGGIESDFEKAGLKIGDWLARLGPLNPEDDKFERKKFKDKNFHATCFNLVAVTQGWPLIKDQRPDLENIVTVTRQNAWTWIDNQHLSGSRDYGCYLDAATACYETTGDKKYLARVPEVAQKLLALQALEYPKIEAQACGDFFNSAGRKDFLWHYKTTSFNIAIHRALLRLARILEPEDPLYFPVRYANEVFAQTYLKQMASKTPYRQLADNLEYVGEGKYKVYYFAGDKASAAAAGDHGLNCDHFALGWVALQWAQQTGDLTLQELAEDQMAWALGKNPLGVCMLIGAGAKNPVIVADFWGKTLNGSIINGPASPDGQSLQYRAEHFGHTEEWIPHNGDYLRLLGSLEADARLNGRVSDKDQPVEGAEVRISSGGKTLFHGTTDKNGHWSSPALPYGRHYTVIVSRGAFGGFFGDRVEYEMDLAAGTRKNIDTRFDHQYAMRIEKPVLKTGEAATFKLHLENHGTEAVTPRLKVYVRGGELKSQPEESRAVELDEEVILEYQIVPNGKEPFFFHVIDADHPQLQAKVYALP